jgi:glycosyltransferase involved in cell wall biosynthesis
VPASPGPSVSIIVPCYNAARTLRQCLTAVHQQHYRPAEVLVVDDASTDGSAAIAAECGVRVHPMPVNQGVSAARNAGVAATTGEIVFFVDADVALAPDAVGNAVEVLLAHPECTAVHGTYDTEPLIDDGPVERYRLLHAAHWRARHLGEVRTIIFALAAVRREALLAAGGLDERLRDSEDVEYSGRVAGRWRIRLTDTVVGRHDDGDRLGPLLVEQYRRARPLVALALRARRDGVRLERANSPLGVLAVAAAIGTAPLALAGWLGAAVPLAALVGFLVADPGLLRFVRRRRSAAFVAYFMAVHLAMHLAIVAGIASGALELAAGRLRRGNRWVSRA